MILRLRPSALWLPWCFMSDEQTSATVVLSLSPALSLTRAEDRPAESEDYVAIGRDDGVVVAGGDLGDAVAQQRGHDPREHDRGVCSVAGLTAGRVPCPEWRQRGASASWWQEKAACKEDPCHLGRARSRGWSWGRRLAVR